jgi:hypothetical protein
MRRRRYARGTILVSVSAGRHPLSTASSRCWLHFNSGYRPGDGSHPGCMFQLVAQSPASAPAPQDLALPSASHSRYWGRDGVHTVYATGWFMHGRLGRMPASAADMVERQRYGRTLAMLRGQSAAVNSASPSEEADGEPVTESSLSLRAPVQRAALPAGGVARSRTGWPAPIRLFCPMVSLARVFPGPSRSGDS